MRGSSSRVDGDRLPGGRRLGQQALEDGAAEPAWRESGSKRDVDDPVLGAAQVKIEPSAGRPPVSMTRNRASGFLAR